MFFYFLQLGGGFCLCPTLDPALHPASYLCARVDLCVCAPLWERRCFPLRFCGRDSAITHSALQSICG